MFYLRYIAAELRRRRARTVLTALGLAVGVGLVVTVTALSSGLDKAQSRVLDPLTGVGTDMSVNRPLVVSSDNSGDQQFGGPGAGLSPQEQRQLQRENGGQQIGLDNLGKPGSHFSQDSFMTTDLSFPQSKATEVTKLDGVDAVAGALTLNATHISGTVPKQSATDQAQVPGGPPVGAPAGGPPNSVNLDSKTVTGIDTRQSELGLITPSQVVDGNYFKATGRDQAVVSVSYANENDLDVGDTVNVGGHKFKIVGTATATVGAQASDIYVELGQLQKLSDHQGRINVLQVRATSADQVSAVSSAIESTFKGSQVTTSADLASEVSGSLVDAKNLSSKLGTALAVVALLAAFGLATLLTLSSVSKRTRELGTLKALGWRRWLVVRQVSAEAVVQGLIGGLLGVIVGLGGAALVGALGITLDASVATQQAGPGPGFGGPPGGGPFGQGAVDAIANTVTLDAPVDVQMIVLGLALAVLGGLIAGGIGGIRAARLRPADALRSVE